MSPALVALGLVGLQLTITRIVIGFVSSGPLLRPAALPLMMLSTYTQLSHVEIQHPIGRAFLGAASVFLVILYIDVALLSQWTFDARGPTSALGGLAAVDSKHSKLETDTDSRNAREIIGEFLERLRYGFGISLQSRFPSTQWQVKNVPPFSRKHPNYVPN